MKQRLFLFLFFSISIYSCKKEPAATKEYDIYCFGNVGSSKGGWPLSGYWKNDIKTVIFDTSYSGSLISDLVVVGKDVYTSGAIYADTGAYKTLKPVYWKNDIIHYLPAENSWQTARSIFVEDNDIYVTGYINNKAIIWKNGAIIQSYPIPGLENYHSLSDYYENGNLHLALTKMAVDGTITSEYWHNGVSSDLGNCNAGYITVSNKDVYISGIDIANQQLILWKNGIKSVIGSAGTEFPVLTNYGVSINNSNVYILARVWNKISGKGMLKYWKNGAEKQLTEISTQVLSPIDFTVFDDQIYTVASFMDNMTTRYCYMKQSNQFLFETGNNIIVRGIKVVER